VDIIVTNPPFGGEEERGILSNFPDDKQTSETALLFLQLIMRRLRRPLGGVNPGRCGMVVPNGVLFGDGISARIKEELFRDFNLQTIIRLPNGVFAPYTPIPTNLVFFDRSGPTTEVWFYEHRPPNGRKLYTKTKPLRIEDLEPILEWWANRTEGDSAWRVSAERIAAGGYNLDLANPHRDPDSELPAVDVLMKRILEKETEVMSILQALNQEIEKHP
jgi:type I restriction enzyme M protein